MLASEASSLLLLSSAMTFTFTVVELPPNPDIENPIWIISLLPRDKLGYVIITKTTEDKYPQLKIDIEKCVSYFTAVSKTIFD